MNAAVEHINVPESSLIPVEQINAVTIFTEGGLKELLARIETEAASHVPDISTDKGRKEIASIAYKVARSKTTIDDAGKNLVSGWKKQAAEVDASRRHARDFLDNLRDKVRRPLAEWEEEQVRIAEEKRIAEEAEQARLEAERAAEEAARLADLEERERKVREAEEAQERARQEQARKEREATEEAARIEREQQLKAEAEERGRQKAAREAEEREQRSLAEEAQKRQEEAARATDKAHRDKINNAIVAAFGEEGIGDRTAQKVIQLVAAGSIPAMSIRY